MKIILFRGKPYLCKKLKNSYERLTFKTFLRLCWQGVGIEHDTLTLKEKDVQGYHFKREKRERTPVVGEWLEQQGPIGQCKSGLHASHK